MKVIKDELQEMNVELDNIDQSINELKGSGLYTGHGIPQRSRLAEGGWLTPGHYIKIIGTRRHHISELIRSTVKKREKSKNGSSLH